MPWTAKDDQPGPIGRRHSSTGGDADQSVAMRAPRTMLLRSGPRKPGQSAPVSRAAGAGEGVVGSSLALTLGRSVGVAAAAGALKGKALRRAKAALKWVRKPQKFDEMAALGDLEAVK